MTAAAFYRTVLEAAAALRRGEAQRATAAVFHALRDRLTPEEATQVAAQLPRPLKDVWQKGERPARRPLKMHRPEFYERVRREAGLDTTREARWMALAVFAALKAQLSPGEAEDVMAQLPKDLKEVWAEATTKASGGRRAS